MLSNGQLLVTGPDRAARICCRMCKFNNTRSTRNSNTETHQFYHNTNLINGTRWGGASDHVGGYRGGPEKRRGKRWHGTATLSAPLEKCAAKACGPCIRWLKDVRPRAPAEARLTLMRETMAQRAPSVRTSTHIPITKTCKPPSADRC